MNAVVIGGYTYLIVGQNRVFSRPLSTVVPLGKSRFSLARVGGHAMASCLRVGIVFSMDWAWHYSFNLSIHLYLLSGGNGW